jgi:hypothetical protein
MKNLFKNALLFLASFCFCITVNGQTIRRVNNNPGVTGVNIYATVQAAHDAAVAGDIVYVEPSVSDFALSLICTKQLTILGNGWVSEFSNVVSQPPQNQLTSKITTIKFNDGSENSKLIGIEITASLLAPIEVNVPNITIDRCFSRTGGMYFGTSNSKKGNNCTITRTRFTSYNITSANNGASGPGANCTIQNCIIGNGSIDYLYGALIQNNILVSAICSNSIISNNIFLANGGPAISEPSNTNTNTISNNLTVSTTGLPNGNGNINGAALNTIFQVATPSSTSTPDNGYQLSVSSPAIGIGTSGVDAGAFGGSNPYKIAGLPPIPIITNFTTSGVGNTTTPLQVSVTVRGNN